MYALRYLIARKVHLGRYDPRDGGTVTNHAIMKIKQHFEMQIASSLSARGDV